jgi:hypothetical protein
MSYTVALHNGTGHCLAALLLLVVGAWAARRVYTIARLSPAILVGVLALSAVISGGMLLWARADGPCGTVRGLPLIVERVQTACIDVITSTGVSLPLAVVDSLVAIGLAHVMLLGVLQLRRTVGQP